jgi:putative transcriptional regulator
MNEEISKIDDNRLPVIKNRIKEILSKRNILQSEFATLLGMSDANMSNIINGKTQVSLPLAFKISYMLNTSVEDIFYDENSIEKSYIDYMVEEEDMIDLYTMHCQVIARACSDEREVVENIRNKNKVTLIKIKLSKVSSNENF